MTAVPHQDELPVIAGVLSRLVVHLGHERTGGVDDSQVAAGRLLKVLGRRAVRREYDGGPLRNLLDVFHSDGALVLQRLDYVGVVDDFVLDIDGRTVPLQGQFDHVDSPDDSGAKAARNTEKHLHGFLLNAQTGSNAILPYRRPVPFGFLAAIGAHWNKSAAPRVI